MNKLQMFGAMTLVALSGCVYAQAPQAPADGITMDMMPISADQIASCRQQASSQLADEQKTLSNREHQQDKDKMKQGAVTGVTGAATSAISRGRGWWGWGSNNGANTAAATGATQRTERNSEAVASTTGIAQNVGQDAYQQCIAGIKGPEYVHFRQTGRIEPLNNFNGTPSTPVAAAATAATPAPAAAPAPAGSPVQDTGDGKHFVLTVPGETDAHEVTLAPGSKNAYIDTNSGDKYIVMPNGTVSHIKKSAGAKKS
ncbi:MAG: hypothetical protein V4734_04895 [Terriglobus sp.]